MMNGSMRASSPASRLVLTVALVIVSSAGLAGSTPSAPDPLAVVRFAERHGVPCTAFSRVRTWEPLVAHEGRCRDYALATFAANRTRSAWYRISTREPWFPGDWVVL